LKSLLLLLCAHKFNGWSDDYHTFISTTLPLPAVDKYAADRSGDVFLSADEEAFRIEVALEAVSRRTNVKTTPASLDTIFTDRLVTSICVPLED
jgi:hypothetical protein